MKKNRPTKIQICSPGISRGLKIRGLKNCIGELKALDAEATSILTALLINPSAAIARDLCDRFHILQAYFSIRHHEAQKLAVSAIGPLALRRAAS
jgi:hypothetical protein